MLLRWTCLAVLLALLLANSPTAADAQTIEVPVYQTVNGPQSWPSLVSQLIAAGYSGPWDPNAVTTAYAHASGGSVTEISQPFSPMTLVEIGGIGTDTTPGGPWTILEPYLGNTVSFRHYQYDTCADIATNVHQLGTYLQTLRPARVVLAGHSLGGVLALSAIGSFDLTGLVQGVVVVDAPVNGLDPQLIDLGQSLGVVPAPCLALDELSDFTWSGTSAAAAQRAISSGIGVLDISNAYDNMVPLAAQELPQPVNLRFDVSSGSGLFNHTAVFSSVAALNAIASFIRPLS